MKSHRYDYKYFGFFTYTTKYLTGKHTSFNFRLGKEFDDGPYAQEHRKFHQQLVEEYKQEIGDPNWKPSLANPGPSSLPRVLISPRHFKFSFHFLYGRINGLRFEFQWRPLRVTDFESEFAKKS